MNYSTRLNNLPHYLFAKLEDKMVELRKRGVDIINLGIGDPDLQPPDFFKDAIKRHIDDADAHFYSTSRGNAQVRKGIADWFKGRFGVELDPETEVAVTIGSKEGLANFSRAVVNPGDKVGVPEPGYPVYGNSASIMNDGVVVRAPLLPENGFLPVLDDFEGCRLVFVNYPNNPTGAVAGEEFYQELADWAEAHPETVVVHDTAYSEMTYGDYTAPSIMQFTREAIEFHSLSKTFNVTGYRIGFAVGKKEYIDGLVKVKSQLDSGAPLFLQRAAVDALKTYNGTVPPKEIMEFREIYSRRRKIVEQGLTELGYKVYTSLATFYVWFYVGGDDMEFLEKTLSVGVVITPGAGFGEAGKGYARIAVTVPETRLIEAMKRLKDI